VTLLPPWAVVGQRRLAHIERVVALLDDWATAMALDADERRDWHDAGRYHDALRDAPESLLRPLAAACHDDRGADGWVTPSLADADVPLLHGPAAARRMADDGERRVAVLEAVRYHTVGSHEWDRVGRALYLADFLEPGRTFARADRAWLARQVPHDFEGTFRQVVRLRLEWALRDGHALRPETVQLWNTVR